MEATSISSPFNIDMSNYMVTILPNYLRKKNVENILEGKVNNQSTS